MEVTDRVAALYARLSGAILLGMAFMSLRAVNFLRNSDKQAVVVSHWIVSNLLGVLK